MRPPRAIVPLVMLTTTLAHGAAPSSERAGTAAGGAGSAGSFSEPARPADDRAPESAAAPPDLLTSLRGGHVRAWALGPGSSAPAPAEPSKEANEPRRTRFFHSARGVILAAIVGALIVGGLARSSLDH
jgi:hypothetical protein